MANPEHLEILKQGVEHWNKWREEHPEPRSGEIPDVSPDLSRDLSVSELELAKLHEISIFSIRARPPGPNEIDRRHAHLRDADLRGAELAETLLCGANLMAANLAGADLTHANLRGADLRGACLVGANLSRAHLFDGIKLNFADLRRANLSGAFCIDTNLRDTYLIEANLSRAHLFKIDLTGACLRDADLSEADLTGANFTQASLMGTDFAEAEAGGTHFDDVDLSTVKGLETVRHRGPSTIGIDTIYKSRGKIPEVFLRGCGVPDEFIAYIGSMVGRPIEFYSCFISYSTKDEEFAKRLHADLQAKGVRCWFAPHDVKGGRKLHEQIDEAIRAYDKLLLILSEHSMGSEWVKEEIARARKREAQEKRQMLFPVALVPYDPVVKEWECFDADRGKDSAREVREYFIPDFSNWKDHDSYQTAFQRLVRDLKAGTGG